MEERIVSFQVAKLAKEKGLHILIKFGFVTKFYHPKTKNLLSYGRLGRNDIESLYYAPTQSLLQRWLREKHNIFICVHHRITGEENNFTVEFSTNTDSGDRNNLWYNTYEEALERGLQEGLKLIK